MRVIRERIALPEEMIDPSEFPPLPEKLELACKDCGHVADYDVGTLLLRQSKKSQADDAEFEDSICFTGYLRCPQCRASGTWSFTDETKLVVAAKMLRFIVLDERPVGVRVGVPLLFDGTICRDYAWGEDYLRSLIAESSDDFYLYSRLANLLLKANLPELAEVELRKAVERNPRDAESWYDLGCLHQKHDRRDEAIHAFQQSLRFAQHADHVKPDLMRSIVEDTIDRLFGMHDPAIHQLNFLPGVEPLPVRQPRTVPPNDATTAVVHLTEVDLSSDAGWERLADIYLPCPHPEPSLSRPARRISAPQFSASPRMSDFHDEPEFAETFVRATSRPGRNDLCPCGSGKKFKRCCGP